MTHFVKEIIIYATFVVCAFLLANPFHVLMLEQLRLLVTFVAGVTFVAFVVLVWKEQEKDERELYHRVVAGGIGYLAGMGTLLLGIVIQSAQGIDNYWLCIALVVMVIAKVGSLVYVETKY